MQYDLSFPVLFLLLFITVIYQFNQQLSASWMSFNRNVDTWVLRCPFLCVHIFYLVYQYKVTKLKLKITESCAAMVTGLEKNKAKNDFRSKKIPVKGSRCVTCSKLWQLQGSFDCFPSLKSPCPLLPDEHYPENCYFIHFVIWGRNVKSSPKHSIFIRSRSFSIPWNTIQLLK